MFRIIIRNILRLFLLLAIAYAGSFVMMEESFEKTEKAEESEQVLHHSNLIKGLKRVILQAGTNKNYLKPPLRSFYRIANHQFFANYNINHIYYTSYLDLHI